MEKTTSRSAEMEKMAMEERIHVIREDLDGDPLLSAKLVKAALNENWEEAERLLDAGADPRICRFGDAFGVESALFRAIRKEQFGLAEKLYDAGDRLDDLVIEESGYGTIPESALRFIVTEMRLGKNLFLDASKPLSECCRCADFSRIPQLIGSATPEELNKSVVPTVYAWIRYYQRTDLFAELLEDLRRRGAKIAEEEKTELRDAISRRFGRCPALMHPGRENVEKILGIIDKF